MLTRILADHFDTVSSIDCEFVAKFSEFSGFSRKSLSSLLSQTITRIVDRMDVRRTELSLPEIAEAARVRCKDSSVKKHT